MTTRVTDVASTAFLKGPAELEPYINTIWMVVLRSLSAYQMYRQYVRRRIVPEDVLAFVLMDEQFPRTLNYCLGQLATALRKLPTPDEALDAVGRLQGHLGEPDFDELDHAALHEWIDTIQLGLGEVHLAIHRTWFDLGVAA